MRRKNILQLLVLLPVFMASCNDWLEVRSNEVLLQEEVFNDGDGVRMAVNGVYREISKSELYGDYLTFGFISVLANHFQDYTLNNQDLSISRYEWGNASVQSITEQIWAKAYNVVANCNNIIQEVSKKDSSFFEYKQKEKDLILGEMYGIRSLLHFEMLRLFAPAPVTGYKELAIPYVTVYPDHQPVRLNMDQVFEKVIADMEEAKRLLAPLDTLYFIDWCKRPGDRFKSGLHGPSWNEFLAYRGHRMNYWGATALLARIYLWKGDKAKAYEQAREVCTFHYPKGVFAWTPASNLNGSSIDNIHTKRWSEILLGFYNSENYNHYETKTASGTWYQPYTLKNMDILFAGETDDYRYSALYRNYVYWVWRRPPGTTATAQTIANEQGPIQTVVRFPEMYHIMAEYLIDQQRYAEAKEIIEDVQIERGVKIRNIPDDNTDNRLMNKLVNEMIREGLTEGQVFYMFKRLNRNIFNGNTEIQMTPEKFTPEYPKNETTYML